MIIKSIQLQNFRQYKGKQDKLNFSVDKDANVTVILGINTSGKTTLIQAFQWCLYGINGINFKSKELLNLELKSEMAINETREVSVDLSLIHDEKEYVIIRTQKFTKTSTDTFRVSDPTISMSYKDESGSMQSIKDIDDTIKKILPIDLSSYFFFDGERVNDLNARRDVKDSVEGLLGLDAIGISRKRLAKLIDTYNKDYQTTSDNRELLEKFNKNESDIDIYKLNIENLKEDIKKSEKIKSSLDEKILANKDVKENQAKKMEIEKKCAVLNRSISESEQQLKVKLEQNAQSFFAYPLMQKALEVLSSAKTQGEGIPNMRIGAIDHILKRGKCICGCDIDEKARGCIDYEKSLLPPQHIGTTISNHKTEYTRMLKNSHFYYRDIKYVDAQYNTALNTLSDNEKELTSLSDKIKGNVDVGQLEKERLEIISNINMKQKSNDVTNQKIGSAEKEIESIRKSLDSDKIASEHNKKVELCKAYAQKLYDYFDAGYERNEKAIKTELLASVNDFFNCMYHGNREVSMTDNYQIELKATVSNTQVNSDESKGLETVKNFSFICGLIHIAKNKLSNSSNEIDLISEPYPLVMDAPFSNADEIHIENISKTIPEVAEQVILMVMKKDWEHASKTLGLKTSKIYEIEKVNNSDTHSIIKEATNV